MMRSFTCVLEGHHHGLLDEVALDEAAEIVSVHGEVGQLEGADRGVQEHLGANATTTYAGHVRASQRHDGGTGVRDPSRQTLLCGCRLKRKHDTMSSILLFHIHFVIKLSLAKESDAAML